MRPEKQNIHENPSLGRPASHHTFVLDSGLRPPSLHTLAPGGAEAAESKQELTGLGFPRWQCAELRPAALCSKPVISAEGQMAVEKGVNPAVHFQGAHLQLVRESQPLLQLAAPACLTGRPQFIQEVDAPQAV